MAVFDQEGQRPDDRRLRQRRIDVMERLGVAEETCDEIVVAEMMNARPQKCPAEANAEKYDEKRFRR